MNDLSKLTDEELSAVLRERNYVHVEAYRAYDAAKKLHEEAACEWFSRQTGLRKGVEILLDDKRWQVVDVCTVNGVQYCFVSPLKKNGELMKRRRKLYLFEMKYVHILPRQ
jgi:hypothetical protein